MVKNGSRCQHFLFLFVCFAFRGLSTVFDVKRCAAARCAAVGVLNRILAGVLGVKKRVFGVKSVPLWVKSVALLIKSASDLTPTATDLIKSVNDLTQSVALLIKSVST